MSLKYLPFCCFIVLFGPLTNVQSKTDLKSTVDKNIYFVQNKLNTLKSSINNAIRDFQGRYESLATEAFKGVDNVVESAKLKVSALNAECQADALEQLNNVKDGFIMDILNCKRIQTMITDIEKIVYSGENLIENFVTSSDNLIDGFKSCLVFNPFKAGYCLTDEMVHTGLLMLQETALAVEFTVSVAEDSGNLIATFMWCIENANENANSTVEGIISNKHSCKQP